MDKRGEISFAGLLSRDDFSSSDLSFKIANVDASELRLSVNICSVELDMEIRLEENIMIIGGVEYVAPTNPLELIAILSYSVPVNLLGRKVVYTLWTVLVAQAAIMLERGRVVEDVNSDARAVIGVDSGHVLEAEPRAVERYALDKEAGDGLIEDVTSRGSHHHGAAGFMTNNYKFNDEYVEFTLGGAFDEKMGRSDVSSQLRVRIMRDTFEVFIVKKHPDSDSEIIVSAPSPIETNTLSIQFSLLELGGDGNKSPIKLRMPEEPRLSAIVIERLADWHDSYFKKNNGRFEACEKPSMDDLDCRGEGAPVEYIHLRVFPHESGYKRVNFRTNFGNLGNLNDTKAQILVDFKTGQYALLEGHNYVRPPSHDELEFLSSILPQSDQ